MGEPREGERSLELMSSPVWSNYLGEGNRWLRAGTGLIFPKLNTRVCLKRSYNNNQFSDLTTCLKRTKIRVGPQLYSTSLPFMVGFDISLTYATWYWYCFSIYVVGLSVHIQSVVNKRWTLWPFPYAKFRTPHLYRLISSRSVFSVFSIKSGMRWGNHLSYKHVSVFLFLGYY